MAVPDSQQYPEQLCLIKFELYIHVYHSWLFHCWLLLWFLYICAFLLQENPLHLSDENLFHIIDQIKVSRVPFWIGHCHFFKEGHFTLRLNHLLYLFSHEEQSQEEGQHSPALVMGIQPWTFILLIGNIFELPLTVITRKQWNRKTTL